MTKVILLFVNVYVRSFQRKFNNLFFALNNIFFDLLTLVRKMIVSSNSHCSSTKCCLEPLTIKTALFPSRDIPVYCVDHRYGKSAGPKKNLCPSGGKRIP